MISVLIILLSFRGLDKKTNSKCLINISLCVQSKSLLNKIASITNTYSKLFSQSHELKKIKIEFWQSQHSTLVGKDEIKLKSCTISFCMPIWTSKPKQKTWISCYLWNSKISRVAHVQLNAHVSWKLKYYDDKSSGSHDQQRETNLRGTFFKRT